MIPIPPALMGFALRAGGILAAVLLVFIFGHSVGGAGVKRQWDAERAEMTKRHLAEVQAAMNQETYWRQQADAAAALHTKEQQRNEALSRDLAAVHARAGRLRNELDAYARGRPDDPAEAIRERAATLGGLLDAALRASAECAADGEAVAGAARRLLAAWPVSPS